MPITPKTISLFGLIIFNIALCVIVVHLIFFAAKGARYTYQDGVLDRQINLDRYNELKSELESINKKYEILLQSQSGIK